jgi:hypothetical protein
MAISACTPQWLSVVQESYSKDARAHQLLIELAVTPTAVPSFTLVNGIIRFKQRVWIGDDTTLHHQILEALHTSAGSFRLSSHISKVEAVVCLERDEDQG